MPSNHDSAGRPIVVVTGMGVVTSLGAGKTDNWKHLTAGKSGIKTISRFATDGLKTRSPGSIANNLADKFGTKGSPISLSTACASGATAIQLGVEAIRRGEADAALCIGADGSINPESLIRFSLLSALSTTMDPPEQAAKPFAKNRDGFVMAEGAGALVLESLEAATARGAKIL